jgi:hypothetical protein
MLYVLWKIPERVAPSLFSKSNSCIFLLGVLLLYYSSTNAHFIETKLYVLHFLAFREIF